MKKPEEIIKNYGILTSISWNSNGWSDHPSDEDLKRSKYEYVKDNVRMHESLNFGQDKYPVEKGGYYIGYTPMFNRPPDVENSKDVHIIFFISSDYHNANRRSIVGFYGEPIFGQEYMREANHPLYKEYNSGNIIAFPENIIFFNTPVIIDNVNVGEENFLPEGKKISQQGFNYLNSDNVYKILQTALELNRNHKKLEVFLKKFPLKIELTKEFIDFSDFVEAIDNTDANSLKSLSILEKKMARATPEVKTRIATFIERGAIAKKVKQINQFQCQICKNQGSNPTSFKKPDGNFYIEAHHVEPVSNKKVGSLSMANIITVCANHHRQLHYGNAFLKFDNESTFVFSIDGNDVKLSKVKIPS